MSFQLAISQKGFTLIELILVIVILGILSAVALPKFANLKNEATIAKLQGMQAALRSGSQMVYGQAFIEDKTSGSQTITVQNTDIQLHSGYPVGNWARAVRYVINLDTVSWSSDSAKCEAEWCGRGNQTSSPSGVTTSTGLITKVYPEGYSWNDQCGVYYVNHNNGTPPEIGLETADC